MSKFGKLDKKQVALVLGLASVLGGSKASAMSPNKNQAKSSQSLGVATNNNSNLLASSKMLKKSKSMSTLAKVGIGVGIALGAVELANEGAGIFTNADTWYKGKFSIANAARHIFGDNMTPEEKQTLAGNILDVINTFDIKKIGESELPKYGGGKLKGKEQEDYDKKYDKDCDQAVKDIKDEQGNSYIDRVSVKEYALGGVMSRGGVADTLNKYKALRVFSFGGASHLGVLKDLQSWDFKNKYNKNDVKEITFAKNRIRIQYNCDEFSWFELQEDGKLKVCFNIGDYSGSKRLITEFTLEKPKK
ncbi:MAG: hypothetical protein IJQ10_00195 [Clostridia bacterium]|nr:hypothetical protein [Clostridia bacterium]